MATPAPRAPQGTVAVVYAGGGTFGIAWHLAVTEALRGTGLLDADTPLIGTSAGAWAAVAARLHVGVDEFTELCDIRVPDPRPGALRDAAARLFGADTTVDGVRIAAVELPRMTRRLFDAADHPACELIAASSAVPGLFAPQRIGGRWCIDGGVRSIASIDAAPPADTLIVSLPLAGRLYGPVGAALEATSRRMVARWRARNGGTSIVLRPTRAVADAVGGDPRALFDTRRATEVYPLALTAATTRLAHRLTEPAPLAA